MKITKKTYITPEMKIVSMGVEMIIAYTRVGTDTGDPDNPGPDWGGEGGDDDWGSVKEEMDQGGGLWDDMW